MFEVHLLLAIKMVQLRESYVQIIAKMLLKSLDKLLGSVGGVIVK
jgi:hypothetical protein